MFIYILICVALFGILGILWRSDDLPNLGVKLSLIVMALSGLVLVWGDLTTLFNQ